MKTIRLTALEEKLIRAALKSAVKEYKDLVTTTAAKRIEKKLNGQIK